MPVQARLPHRSTSRRARTRLRVESLEARSLPSVTGWSGLLNPLIEAENNDTLDLAHDLGEPSVAAQTQAIGTIGNSSAVAADIDWYSFTLSRAATVRLTMFDQEGGPFSAVLGLYNNATDVFDPYVLTSHRLLAQDEGAGACLEQLLAPGTYFVAVSGAGNRYFHPFLADSGAEGETGDYALIITATDFQPSSGSPEVLSADPADGAVLDRSPFVFRLTFSDLVDFSTIAPGVNVTLTYNPTGNFGDGNDQDVPLLANFSWSANELQLMPVSPVTFGPQALALGHYRLFLAQDSSTIPLAGDYLATFEINGSETRTGAGAAADDTAATAHDLGDVTGTGLIQIAGVIGDDPAYNPANADPLLANPAADVDLYHFLISGPDNYALIVQVSAGSIGYGYLDPAVSLFQNIGGQLQLVAVNDNTLNDSQGTDGTMPLSNDSVLFAGLRAGDYYLAVSGTGNLPDPALGIDPGTNGVFDPTVSHSGANGFTIGNYALSLLVHPDNEAPAVEEVSWQAGAVLDTAPTHFTVRFNEPVNLRQLAYLQYLHTAQGDLAVVFLRGADGVDYYPRLLSYDTTTNQAEFLLLDRLPNGVNELHLSGALGLMDLAGNPLAGSDPDDASSDFVVSFTVNAPVAGSAGDSLLWLDQEPNNTLAEPQVLGVLFPHELRARVTIRRDFTADPASAPSDTADYYQFEVLQGRGYFFGLFGTSGLPPGTRPQLFDADGNAVFTTGGAVRLANLDPGIYFVRVGGWTSAQASNAKYGLRITLGGSTENPTPLTSGPAPAYRIRLATSNGTGGNTGGGNTGGGNTGGNTGGGTTDGGNTGGNTGGTTVPPSLPPPVIPPPVIPPLVIPPPVIPPLVSPQPPAQGGNGSVVQAIHTTSPINTLIVTDLLSNALSLFSELPVGGSRDTNSGASSAVANRLVLPENNQNPLAHLGNRLIVSGWYEDLPFDRDSEKLNDPVRPALENTWQQMLEFLFGPQEMPEESGRLDGEYSQPLLVPRSLIEETLWDFNTPADEYPETEAMCQLWDAPADLSSIDLVMAAGLTTAAVLVPVDRKKARKASTALPRKAEGQ